VRDAGPEDGEVAGVKVVVAAAVEVRELALEDEIALDVGVGVRGGHVVRPAAQDEEPEAFDLEWKMGRGGGHDIRIREELALCTGEIAEWAGLLWVTA
jgi:hypothetical protein